MSLCTDEFTIPANARIRNSEYGYTTEPVLVTFKLEEGCSRCAQTWEVKRIVLVATQEEVIQF